MTVAGDSTCAAYSEKCETVDRYYQNHPSRPHGEARRFRMSGAMIDRSSPGLGYGQETFSLRLCRRDLSRR
jgi:hypothetical protein